MSQTLSDAAEAGIVNFRPVLLEQALLGISWLEGSGPLQLNQPEAAQPRDASLRAGSLSRVHSFRNQAKPKGTIAFRKLVGQLPKTGQPRSTFPGESPLACSIILHDQRGGCQALLMLRLSSFMPCPTLEEAW